MTGHLRQVAVAAAQEAPVDELPNFDLFFEEHRRRLFGAFCLITGNHHEAEEIVQDAFLKAWERWDRVGGLDDPVGFVFTTAMNLFRNRARRAALAVRKTMIATLRTDDLTAVDDRMELIAVLHALTPRQRAAVVLTDYLGYAAVDAAKVLGIEPSTVRSLSAKGRDAARQVAEGRS
jgi:RNA polymerase sigma-70 factor, ECF subfamily